jgi:O-Antigen ligase
MPAKSLPPVTLKNAALAATLLVPLGLLHAFVLAEACIAVTDILFLTAMARERNFAWARQPWFVVALVWWAWLLLCSLPLPGLGLVTAGWSLSFLQAFVIIRLLLFAVALQSWVLTTQAARRAVWLTLALSSLWIGIESWQQYLTGRNLFGDHRWGDGALTGPFWKPRAGALYGHLLAASLLPPVLALLNTRPSTLRRAFGMLLAILGVVTSVLIGQRVGTAFAVCGLLVAALLVPQLRRVAALAVAGAVLVLLATPIISPATHAKLVGETSRQLAHFTTSPYGELYTRAARMGLSSVWHGWGYNGFRAFCPEPRFAAGFPDLGIAPTELSLGACNLHPHNFYMQAFTDAGLPGLILFAALNLCWLLPLLRGLWRRPEPLRLGLFIAVLTFSWPITSTDAFPTLYMSGWQFLLLGLGLAAAQIPSSTASDRKHV